MRDNIFRAQSGFAANDQELIKSINDKLYHMPFDPVSRDRRVHLAENDLEVDEHGKYDSPLIRLRIKQINLLDIGLDKYLKNLSTAEHYKACPYNQMEDAIRTSNDLLPRYMLTGFDADKEAILWHGTRESASNELVSSLPKQNKGAYGLGFYLTPHLGKADQYAIADGEEGKLCLIAYRVIMQGVQYNTHLRGSTSGGPPPTINYVTKNRTETPVRYHEVVTRCEEDFIVPVAAFVYERYSNAIAEDTVESESQPIRDTGLRRRTSNVSRVANESDCP